MKTVLSVTIIAISGNVMAASGNAAVVPAQKMMPHPVQAHTAKIEMTQKAEVIQQQSKEKVQAVKKHGHEKKQAIQNTAVRVEQQTAPSFTHVQKTTQEQTKVENQQQAQIAAPKTEMKHIQEAQQIQTTTVKAEPAQLQQVKPAPEKSATPAEKKKGWFSWLKKSA